MTNKYKPKPKYKLLAAYWWNPCFWIFLFATPIAAGLVAFFSDFVEAAKEVIISLKEWDLN